ncbi:flagellar basal body P-ring formation chaperone FlgA [Rhizobium sp. BR 314]|nr:flagellar basal body P-ring formation chaperone FlgA [Rhizobium lusitanum]
MRFRRMKSLAMAWFAAASLSVMFAAAAPGGAAGADTGGMGTAVVPTETIYPGDIINKGQLEEVEVTNPNLTGDYAKRIPEVTGRVSKRTLLPGRTISISSLRQPYAVTRGSNVRLVMSMGTMTITAAGTPLDDGAVGDSIRARNMDSGIIVNGTVLENGTIRVVAK